MTATTTQTLNATEAAALVAKIAAGGRLTPGELRRVGLTVRVASTNLDINTIDALLEAWHAQITA